MLSYYGISHGSYIDDSIVSASVKRDIKIKTKRNIYYLIEEQTDRVWDMLWDVCGEK